MSGFLGGQIVMTVFFSKIGLNSIKEYLLDFIKSNPTKKKKNEDNILNLDNKNNTNESNVNKMTDKSNTNGNNIIIYKNLNN